MPGKILLRQKKNDYGESYDQKEVLLAAAGFGLWIAVLWQVLTISAPAVTKGPGAVSWKWNSSACL